MLIDTTDKCQDVKDFLFITEYYSTKEPNIRYDKDIRCLAIGNRIWAMARRGKF